ncbi:MAG: hypothetical protein IKA44_03725 [Clostridia bacterium]|nr:hypothetical protein [Clostridia bacterium]
MSICTFGFDIDGIHYVRYKRSAGSSRDGRCLFIAESNLVGNFRRYFYSL